MPQSFGGGVGWPPQRSFPTAVSREIVPAFTQVDVSFSSSHGQFVLTCIDITSEAGSGGFAETIITHLSSAWVLWPINIGSAEDSFSWRGMFPMIPNDGLRINNGSAQSIHWLASGFWVMDSAFIS